MSKSSLAIHSGTKPKPLEKRPSRIVINTKSREVSLEPKKPTKNLGITFSPYATQTLQFKSIEKNDCTLPQGHFRMSSKDKLTSVHKKNRKNSGSLNSLIGDERSKSVSFAQLSKKLIKRIDDICESTDYIDLYFDAFDEIITNAKDFGKVLTVLKTKLWRMIKSLKKDKEDKNIAIKNLEQTLEGFKSENQKLTKRNKESQEEIKKLSQEFSEISLKYYQLASIEIKDTELNYDCLKKLKQENMIFQDLMFRLKDELSFYKKKTKKFCRLIDVLESKGVPVEEIYLTEMKKSKIMPKYAGLSEAESCTENESLEMNVRNPIKKHNFVPSLKLGNIEKETSSDDFSSTSPIDRLMDL